MKIAVTYDNGNIFQHFGRTEQFKVYEVEDNKVVSSEVIGSDGIGHGALAGLLADRAVDVLICGGLGGGAQAALAEAGVEVCAGAEGDADQAVEAYLKGELVSTGANCDHHHHWCPPAQTATITITRTGTAAVTMKRDTAAAATMRGIPAVPGAEAAAAGDAAPDPHLPDAM